MREVLAFLVWLFSFWTWKDFFLRWFRRSLFSPAGGEIAEHLPSQEEQQVSELAQFLSSSPKDGRWCDWLSFTGDSKVTIDFIGSEFTLFHVQASYREFLEAVASSKILFCKYVGIVLHGDDSCKYVEAFADAYRQCGNSFRGLRLICWDGSAMRIAKYVSSVLLGNDDIQDLYLGFHGLKGEMDKELATEFMDIIAVPQHIRIFQVIRNGYAKFGWRGNGVNGYKVLGAIIALKTLDWIIQLYKSQEMQTIYLLHYQRRRK